MIALSTDFSNTEISSSLSGSWSKASSALTISLVKDECARKSNMTWGILVNLPSNSHSSFVSSVIWEVEFARVYYIFSDTMMLHQAYIVSCTYDILCPKGLNINQSTRSKIPLRLISINMSILYDPIVSKISVNGGRSRGIVAYSRTEIFYRDIAL